MTGRMYNELFQFPPGREGYYGPYGGAFIPEVLHETIKELAEAFTAAQHDPTFWKEFVTFMAQYSGRTALCEARRSESYRRP